MRKNNTIVGVNPTLVCLLDEKIDSFKYKTFTIKNIESLPILEAKEKIFNVYCHNIRTLQTFLDYCNRVNFKSYRITSNLFPKYVYLNDNDYLDDTMKAQLLEKLKNINTHGIFLSMHPDQFVVLNSTKEDVVKNSIKELRYHFYLAEVIGFDTINIHVGGAYGDKESAIKRFITNVNNYLTNEERKLLTIENDEKSYNIDDVIKICCELNIRPVFDIHHEKCYNLKMYNKNTSNIHKLDLCKIQWKKLGYDFCQIHISSPKNKHDSFRNYCAHARFIEKEDMEFLIGDDSNLIVDIEAKGKEQAVKRFNMFYKGMTNKKYTLI